MTTNNPIRMARNCRQVFIEDLDFNFQSENMSQMMGKGSGRAYPFPKDTAYF